MSKVQILEKNNKVRNIKTSNFFKSRISEKARSVNIKNTVPFKIKITNIGVPNYGFNNPAPIGIAVIGFSNYIL